MSVPRDAGAAGAAGANGESRAAALERARRHPVGLCAHCLHHRAVGNRKGSIFYMCTRSRTDPRYRKYPPLPVLDCPGWEPGGEDPWESFAEEHE
jgi:hypothetical protein